MEEKSSVQNIVCGRNAVRELLAGDTLPDKIYLLQGQRHGSILPIVAEAKRKGVPVEDVRRARLDELCGAVAHQGIAALYSGISYKTVDELLAVAESRGEKPLLVIADRIADPGNFGALLRSCEGVGAHGVIFPKHEACPVNATVMKASAGAAFHLGLCRVTNLARTVDALKEKGLWICALEADGEDYASFDYDLPLALILGSEERGVSRLLREKSDFCISLPMRGHVNSLNVSCAGAVVLYAADAARRTKSVKS